MLIRRSEVEPFDFDGLVIADYTTGRGELSSSLARIEVAPGVAHMLSWSTRSDKYYYVVSGRLEFEVDGAAERLEPGDALVIRQGQRFRYANDSDEPAALLLVHTPPFLLEAERFEP
jgi:mannose-6-phosphate isomerase-like protein (cupin superfamily)